MKNNPRIHRGATAQAGFTLIEIMIVLALIGVIIAIVVDRIGDSRLRGMVNATKIKVETLAGKIEIYSTDVGAPPSRLEDLVTKPADADGWLGPYAKADELKDPWKKEFIYRYPGEHGGEFDLYSYGPDGREGGEGLKGADITNW